MTQDWHGGARVVCKACKCPMEPGKPCCGGAERTEELREPMARTPDAWAVHCAKCNLVVGMALSRHSRVIGGMNWACPCTPGKLVHGNIPGSAALWGKDWEHVVALVELLSRGPYAGIENLTSAMDASRYEGMGLEPWW